MAVKVGASEASRAAALAHTGSLAGSAEAFEAVAGSAGVVRFNSFEDAIEAVEFLARLPLPHGRNIALMTISGALRGLATEAAERTGATLAVLSERTKDALNAVLGEKGASNPFDTKRTIPAEQYAKCLDTLVDAPEVDIVLTAEDMPLDKSVERRVGNLLSIGGVSRRATSIGKTVAMFTPLSVSMTEYGRSVRAQIPDVPVMRETERTLRVVDTLARAGARPIHPARSSRRRPTPNCARRWRARAAALDRPTALNEVEFEIAARRIRDRAAAGASRQQPPTMPSRRRSRSASRWCSRRCRRRCRTRATLGLVRLNLADADAVRQAAAEIAARASSLPAPLDGMLVAKQVSGGTEVVLGVQRDVEMGPVVMFGMGGVLVELFKDVSFAPATLDRARAREMVARRAPAACCDGFRGRKPATSMRSATRWSISAGSRASLATSSNRSTSIRCWCASRASSRSTRLSCCDRRARTEQGERECAKPPLVPAKAGTQASSLDERTSGFPLSRG